MDPNYANAGGGSVGSVTAAGIGASAADRYNPIYYKDQASCQRSISYNAYDPYGGCSTGVRASSVYPYDAEAEFKERTGMGKAKTSNQQMAGSVASNSAKQYNLNSCYGNYNQTNATALAPENYYAYAYDQHHHYPPQQQQYHQSQLQQHYKYKVAGEQQQQLFHQQQQQQQQQNALNAAMKMSPPEYGYAPYHHPYYHPHYHHPQKGGVNVVKSLPDASGMPYVNSKVLHSPAIGGGRAPPYPSYHSYPASTVAAGHHHHTYQNQSVCDDSRWLWNTNNNSNTTNGSEYQNSCRGAYPLAKQNTMWPPATHMQYQNTMSTGYPAAAAIGNQSCCPPTPSASTYYPSQQYGKYSVNFSGSNNDLYSNSQVNASLPAATTNATSKVYTDLNAQPQANAYQSAVSTVSYHQAGDCSVSSALDHNGRYLQPQQTDSPSGSSASSNSSYSHHYYHPYAHQPYSAPGPQEQCTMYAQQQVDTKIGLTTKSQSLRDFLTSWNEDEDECADRAMSSADVPFIEQLHLTSEHFSQDNPIMENHLQFKGSFSSRPKIHVGITVDSTVESDQYINLPDIIIDIEKSSKEVVSLAESVPMATVPMATIPKEEITIKEEKNEDKPIAPPPPPPKMKRKFSRLTLLQKMRQTKRNQRKWKKAPRKLKIRRTKIRSSSSTTNPPLHLNPQSLKCLCVSLINSEKFRNRILGPSEIVDSLINLTTADSEAIIDVAAANAASTAAAACSDTSSSVIPKLSDLCKNALNSSFDRDVLVINLDEILDSDNLFVVQCDINENILENYVDVDQLQQQPERPQQSAINNVDLVEILNDNNNNNHSTSSRNYIPTTTTVAPKRCCSVTEVSNLPLDNPVEHNNLNLPTNPSVHTTSPPPPTVPSSPSSSSCPAVLCYRSSSSPPLIEQNCPTKQNTAASGGHEQLHEMLMLSAAGIVHDDISQDHHHHHHLSNDSDLLMLDTNSTPSIHHEEIVPDNLKKFQNEKFLKYLHAKYVQGNLSEFYHANRIIKKYKKRIIKKLLNIVVR